MENVVVSYSEKLKIDLEKYDIPFAYDDKNIIVFVNKESYIVNMPAFTDMIPAIVPVLKRKIHCSDNLLLKNWSITTKDFFYISCCNYNSLNSQKPPKIYKTLLYGGEKILNSNKQRSLYTQEVPDYAIPIKDDAGEIIGLMSYNLILIFFSIFCSDLKPLHLKLIEDTVNSYIKIESSLKELFDEYAVMQGKIKLIKYIEQIAKLEQERIKRDIHSYEETIKERSIQIVELHQKLRNSVLKLRGLESEKIDIEGEFEKLITDFNIKFNSDGLIWFDTENIKYKDILLGKFRILLDIQKGVIKINNITKKIGAFDHPHIREGVLCLGELSNTVSKLMSEYKYIEVAKLCKEMLYFYNPSSAYKKVEEWREKISIEHT